MSDHFQEVWQITSCRGVGQKGPRPAPSFYQLIPTKHNVKSDLIWRKYSPWWLYKAIAIKWGDLGRAGNFGRCLLGTYWGTPDGWHTLTQTNTNTFQYWALLAVKWWPLLPKYGHKSNKINGIELFSLQSLYIYSQEPKKALNLPKFWPPIFPANRAKFYIVLCHLIW